MPRVTPEYREARRDEITAAALRVFAARGFAGTSMSDIIAESGLSAGAIYGHFESKHDIMMSVARQAIGERIEGLRELGAASVAPSPADVVTGMIAGMGGQATPTSLLLQVWGQAMVEEGVLELLLAVFADIRAAYEACFAAWAMQHDGLDEAAAREWSATLVPVALGLAQGFIVQSAVFADFDAPAYIASVHRLLPH